jgi:predicted LPLAT superfamily acyltransferase
MKKLFYDFLIVLSKKIGPWIFVLVSWGIAAGYFVFFPRRVAIGCRFYKALFPDRLGLYHAWCTWRQYQNFTSVFMDRFFVRDFDNISYTSDGWENLEAAMGKTGGIILMSHVGNWDVAAHLMKKKHPHMDLLLYIGAREKEEIERAQKEDLQDSGVRVVPVDQDAGAAFVALDGIHFIKSGGIVSMTGDKVWKKGQRTVSVQFLRHCVLLPEFPYVLSMLAGAPLFIFFTFRTGPKKYHLTLSEPIRIAPASRDQRQDAIRQCAQRYAHRLEQTVRRRPFEWYHFEPFLGPEIPKTGCGGGNMV